jgi:energy-converting hydrogenase Eha subunit A
VNRSTAELVVLILATMVAAVVVAAIIGLIAVELDQPGTDVSAIAASLGTLVTAALGVTIGFVLGGRGNGGPR